MSHLNLRTDNGTLWGQTWTTFRPLERERMVQQAVNELSANPEISPIDVARRIAECHNLPFVDASGIVLSARRLVGR